MEEFDFRVFPVIQTARLTLRQVRDSDAEAIYAFRSDPDVSRYNGAPYEDLEESKALIERLTRQFNAKTTLSWAMTLTGDDQVIGLCGFGYWARVVRIAELGFDLAKAHWGQGLTPEAASAVMHFGFEHMNLNRIVAEVHGNNHASVRVMEKLGFVLEGILRDDGYENGAFHDQRLYGLLRREYYSE